MQKLSVFIMALLIAAGNTQADVTPEQVRAALDHGVKYLRASGVFARRVPNGTGVHALAVLAMINAGVPKNDPDVIRGAEICAGVFNSEVTTYHVGLVATALAAVDPGKYSGVIKNCAVWLMRAQNADGGWRYQARGGEGGRSLQVSDHSCTQFALLGLRAADDSGITIPDATWKLAEKYLLSTQNADGGWSYVATGESYGSMTAAGLGGLYICGMRLHESAERCGEYKQNRRLAGAFKWVADNFSVRDNPRHGAAYHGYYLYGLERVCSFSGRKTLGGRDWYAEGAEQLVKSQRIDGSWAMGSDPLLDTAFGLLFLGKASSSVLVQKLDYGPGWNTDLFDADNLSRVASKELGLKASWQSVTLDEPIERWLDAPVLEISGHGELKLTESERAKMREFIDRGGTIIADACCGNQMFDSSFRKEMALVFPNTPLAKLPPEHPVYQVPHKINNANLQVWEAIAIGCRTAVYYSKKDLSCAWDGNVHAGGSPVIGPDAFRLGVNVVAQALGFRPLKDKLEKVAPRIGDEIPDDGRVSRGALVFVQLKHEGDYDPDPTASRAMLATFSQSTGARVNMQRVDLDPTDPLLTKYPFIYMTGHRRFEYDDKQVKALREYFARGGFMFADACCGRREFDESFRALVAKVFPNNRLQILSLDHKLFKCKYVINHAAYRPILKVEVPQGEADKPCLEAVVVDGRAVLVYSPYDLGCAFEEFPCANCRGLTPESAKQLLVNILLYGMSE